MDGLKKIIKAEVLESDIILIEAAIERWNKGGGLGKISRSDIIREGTRSFAKKIIRSKSIQVKIKG